MRGARVLRVHDARAGREVADLLAALATAETGAGDSAAAMAT